MATSKAIASLPNLGPVMAQRLAAVGIHTEDDLRKAGSMHAWVQLRFHFGKNISRIALHAMEAALTGCDWRALPHKTKEKLNTQADKHDPIKSGISEGKHQRGRK